MIRYARSILAGGQSAARMIIVAVGLWAWPFAVSEAQECPVCAGVEDMAESLEGRATRLINAAREARESAEDDGDTEQAAHLAVIAKGVETLAGAAREAASGCVAESECRPAPTPVSAQAQCPLPMTDDTWEELLAPANALASALVDDARTCSLFACPDADCTARAQVLEQASFAEALLSALVTQPASLGDAEDQVVGDEARPSTEGKEQGRTPADEFAVEIIAALGRVSRLPAAGGLDPDETQSAAQTFAALEERLAASEEDGASWRHLAARLALAGMRDALTTLRLRNNAHLPANWDNAAFRLKGALTSAMRLGMRPYPADQTPAFAAGTCQPPGLPVKRTRIRLQAALNRAASCSVRTGCRVEEALMRGRLRARQLLASPAMEEGLEFTRALEEEVGMPRTALAAAAAREGKAPVITLDQTSYRSGEAIEVTIDPAGNRCLMEGGHLALLPFSDGTARAPFATIDRLDTSALRRRVKGQGAESLVRLAAPARGAYRAHLFAAEGAGGRRLMSLPVQIADGEPVRCDGWTGVWQTEFGRLVTVAREGGEVSGSYRRRPDLWPGFLTGTVADGVLTGHWTSDISGGGTRLRLRGEGIFQGHWGLSPASRVNGGRWSGICVAREKPDAETVLEDDPEQDRP
jgi:hypothetical protein